MRKYNFIQAIPLSFFSHKLYRDVAKNWGGDAFLYLFFLMALVSALVTYRVQVDLNTRYAQISEKVVPQIPVLTMVKGKLSTPENRPYEIVGPNSNEVIAIIDTSGRSANLDKANALFMITEDSIVTNEKDEVSIRKLPDITTTIEPTVVDQGIKKYIGFAWVFIYLGVLIGSYVVRLVFALFYALIGRILAAMFRADLTYGQVLQLALGSIIPAIIIVELIMFSTWAMPHNKLLSFCIAMLYLIFAVLANKKSST